MCVCGSHPPQPPPEEEQDKEIEINQRIKKKILIFNYYAQGDLKAYFIKIETGGGGNN